MEPRENAVPVRPWPIVAVMVAAQMLIWLDSSIINVAVTTLADPVAGLGAGAGELEWIASAYTLVFASTLLAGGALADRVGPRTTLLAGLITFAVAATVGAYATEPGQLIAARGLMGAGSGLLMPSTLSIIVLSTPLALRTRAIAMWGSSSGLGVAIGPVAGGALLSHFWWGSVFLVNVPIVVLCLLAIVGVVPALHSPQRRALDLTGLVLSTLGLGALVYGVIEVGRGVAWNSPRAFAPILAGLALIGAFVLSQRRSATPSLDLRLFAERRFAAGNAVLLLAFMGLSGQLFFAAFYLQGPRGLSPQTAGAIMIAAAVGIVLGSNLAPAATRSISARWTSAAGMLASGATYASYLWLDERTSLASIAALLFVQGFGMGLIGTPITVTMMAGVPAHLTGAASAIGSVTRQVGSTLGVAVTGALLAAVYRQELAPALAPLPARDSQRAGASVEAARSLARSLGQPALAQAADRAFLSAMDSAAIFTSLLAAAGFVVAAAGLYVRGRHRADRSVAAQRRPRSDHAPRFDALRHQPPAARGPRRTSERDWLDWWTPGGGEATAELALHQLKIVLAIAEAGSLEVAASALKIPKPALADNLNRIEHRFGGPLFERSADGGVAMTSLGIQVIARARELVNEVSDLLTAARMPSSRRPSGNITRIGGVESPLLRTVAQAVQDVLPGSLHTTRVESTSNVVMELFRIGELDLAVVAEFPGVRLQHVDKYNSAVLLTEPLFIGVCAAPSAGRAKLHPAA